MTSRLLARAQRSSSADSSRPEDGALFEAVPEVPYGLACRPRGALDADSVESLSAGVTAALGETLKILFLDFSRVEDMTSAGVGFLVALQKRLRGRGGELILYGLRPKQQRFLAALGFGEFFSIALDLRYAVEYILGMKRDIFPVSAACPACSSPLGADGPGRSRCRACGAVLTVRPDGSVELG